VQWVGSLMNITTRKQLQDQLVRSQKMEAFGQLAGGVAHDFNNLLVGMLTNAGLALAELPPDSPTRPTVAEIEKSASHAADLCRQLLAYSGRGKYVVQPTDLNELVTTSRHLIDVSAAKNVSVEFRPGESLPPVEGDVTQLRQVLMNLVINASEAIGERGGTVTISTGCAECAADELVDTGLSPGSYVSLEVADTGCGMSEEVRKRIFEPFFSTKFTGRGLGLAAVVGIVRGHHGAITVSSREGEDSTFRVLLPACSRPAVPLAKPEPAPANWAGTGTVLVVDDDDSVRLVAQRFFEGAGFCVLSAASGASAVDVFRDRADDVRLVLLDLTMPGKSGEETFRELREVRPEVKVILTSGYSEQEMSDRFAANGPAGFVQKPWRPAELLDRVRTVLA
jgi:two-component system cell cycle sensor histidine kinase/response regulator CckA